MVGWRTKRGRRIALALGVFLVLFCVVTARLFVMPDLNSPARSDAIVVLGGTGLGPVDEGIKLATDGYSPNLVFSLQPWESCPRSTMHGVTIRCFRANPQSTRGEARSIAALARRYHWQRIIVVMPTTQATRARLRIGRCYPGQVLEVGVTPASIGSWAMGIAYEWGALLKAVVLQPSC
jgi:uncharacterized SAM-binding protein YcdF (DUF218 family)